MWIGVLGPLCVRHEGRHLPLPDGKQRSVLVALALSANRAVSLDELADTVWDGSPPAAAEATLRNYVSRLRHALGPGAADRLATGRFGYLMHLADEELDAARFESDYRTGSAAGRAGDWSRAGTVLTEALALWRGSPLTDVPSQTLRQEHGERLAQLRLQVLEQRLEAELRLGRHDESVTELRDLSRRYPLHERFHAQLMLALARGGRQAEALTVYQLARRLLIDELGIDPGPELQRVHRQILDGEIEAVVAAAPPPSSALTRYPAQLPADAPDFVGRPAAVRQLSEALLAPGGPAVQTVCGAAGTGKTALAVHVAHRLREHFADGQIHVDLRGSEPDPEPPAEVLARLLRDLGLPPEEVPADVGERAARYRSLLAGRRTLVLLDDARDAAQIRSLLPGGGRSRALVTSRARLGGVDGAGRLDLGALDADEARELFNRIIGRQWLETEPEAVDELLRACAGLPLAVRIAAGRLGARPDWSVRALADRLADERRRLDELVLGDLAVRTGFDAGYAALSGSATAVDAAEGDPGRCLRLLGLTTGPDIGVPAAAALLDLPAEQAEAALEALVDANLLSSEGPGRYALHGLARAYAVERAAVEETPGTRSAAQRRLLTWYLRTAAAAAEHSPTTGRQGSPVHLPDPAAGPEVDFGHHPDAHGKPGASDSQYRATAWLVTELPNLVAAVHQAVQLGHDDVAWQLSCAVWEFLALRQGADVAVELCGTARSAAVRLGEPEAEAHVLTRLVVAHQLAGRCHEALYCGRQALGIWQALGDRWMRAEVLLGCSAAHRELGRLDEAVRDLDEVLAFHRDHGHRAGECAALLALGVAHRDAGRSAEAVTAFEACLRIAQETDDHRTEGDALAELVRTTR